jgi:hypothetical protein
MRIYHRKGAAAVTAGGVTYQAEADGGFEGLPGPVEQHLLGFPDWETEVQREQRRVREDLARRRDPASQYDELASLRADFAAGLRNTSPPQSRDDELADLRKRLADLEARQARTPSWTDTGHPADGTMSPPASNDGGAEPQPARPSAGTTARPRGRRPQAAADK